MDLKTQEAIANKWDTAPRKVQRSRWWQSRKIIRHINKNVCGREVDGPNQGLIEVLKMKSKVLPYPKGLSIGCGTAIKEFNLLKQNIVGYFDLYELSPEKIKIINKDAIASGLQDRIVVNLKDFFSTRVGREEYDFIHWDNSLHHMLDVFQAVKISREMLRPGGVFFMNDYVGPSRFQWPDRQIEYINRYRKILPDSYFVNPENGMRWPKEKFRPSISSMITDDPSEAADSANILPAIKAVFPQASFLPTGGVIYHVGLNDILANISEDSEYLSFALFIDDLCSKLGDFHYAVALAFK